MELIPIECGSCNAKLKIKAMPGRMLTEVKCPKCGKPIPIAKGAPAASPPAPTRTMPPVASKPITISPVAPAAAPQVAPASSTAQLTPPPKTIQQAPASQPATTVKKAAAPIVLGQVPDASSGSNIPVVCPTCQWQTKVSQTLIGKKIKCKQCSGIIPIAAPGHITTAEAPIEELVTEITPEPVEQEPPAPIPAAPEPIPEPVPTASEIIQRLRPEPATPPTPVAQWTPRETTLMPPLTTARTSPGTTVLVGEIATLKSKLEAAIRESSITVMRLDEAEKKIQDAEARTQKAEALSRDAETRAQKAEALSKYADTRAKEAEHTLHDLAGKSAIETVTANRKISELETEITALKNSLAAVTNEFAAELALAEQHVTRLKGIMAARNSYRN